MGQNKTSGYSSYYCRGKENFSDHCTHNGPSKAVWMEMIVAALFIFGLFYVYVKFTQKRESIRIPWNLSDESDIESNSNNNTAKPITQEYRHMHPTSTEQKAKDAPTKIKTKAAAAEEAQNAEGSTYQAPIPIPPENKG